MNLVLMSHACCVSRPRERGELKAESVLRMTFDIYQYILNSPDTLLENSQASQRGDLPRIVKLYLRRYGYISLCLVLTFPMSLSAYGMHRPLPSISRLP